MFWYQLFKVLHILMMSAWFGAAVAVSVIWRLRQRTDQNVSHTLGLAIIRQVESITSLVGLVAGIVLLIIQPHWLQQGWLHTKILIWLIALGLSYMSAGKLKKIMQGQTEQEKSFMVLRNVMWILLIIAVILVEYKPF